MDASPMTVWLVALRNGRRLELEGDAGLFRDLLCILRPESECDENEQACGNPPADLVPKKEGEHAT